MRKRFNLNSYIVDEVTGCWNFIGHTNHKGYGYARFGGEKKVRAHRYFYEQLVGPIPEGYEPHHTCENRRCVNPCHMVLKTVLDHKAEHGRLKLDWGKVAEIRRERKLGVPRKVLADRFGIRVDYVTEITCGRWWKEG